MAELTFELRHDVSLTHIHSHWTIQKKNTSVFQSITCLLNVLHIVLDNTNICIITPDHQELTVNLVHNQNIIPKEKKKKPNKQTTKKQTKKNPKSKKHHSTLTLEGILTAFSGCMVQ